MKDNRIKDYNWKKFWGERPKFQEKVFSWYESRVCLKVLRKINIKTCLELGGGPGYMAKIIAQKMDYELTLIDNSKEAYKYFKKISNFGNYVLGDYFKYSPRHKFDLVFSFGVIEHYSREKRFQLIKIHKKLSRKYVLIYVPKDCFLVRNFFYFPENGYEKLYQREELEYELKQSGLKLYKYTENIRAIGYLCKVI